MKKKKIWIFIIVVLSILVSLYFDDLLVKSVSFLRNNILDYFFLSITFISSKVIFFFILTILLLWKADKRNWILPLWFSFGISALISLILKTTVQRMRPFQLELVSLMPRLQEASYDIWNFSFPSSHAMFAFCAIPILFEQFPKLKKFWIILAVIIAFSRVYFGLHFMSDIIAGGLIGYVIGLIIVRKEKENKFGQRIYNKIFKK